MSMSIQLEMHIQSLRRVPNMMNTIKAINVNSMNRICMQNTFHHQKNRATVPVAAWDLLRKGLLIKRVRQSTIRYELP